MKPTELEHFWLDGGITQSIKPRPRRTLITVLRLHFAKSSIPGLKTICDFGSSRGRRLCWIVVFAILFFLTLKDIYHIVSYYITYPVAVNVEVSTSPVGLEMPAVTVCNLNVFRKSLFCHDHQPFIRSRLNKWKTKLCLNTSETPSVVMTEEQARDAREFHNWVIGTLRREWDLSGTMGHQLRDMLVDCVFNDLDCRDESYFEVRASAQFGNCYCFNCNAAKPLLLKPAYSADDGLTLLLDVQLDEYLPVAPEAGFRVMVHNPGNTPRFPQDGVFVPALRSTYIKVSKTTFQRMERPYPFPCQHDWPEGYTQYLYHTEKYAYRTCLDICAQLNVIRECGCMDDSHMGLNMAEEDMCPENIDSDICIAEAHRLFVKRKTECPCLKPCLETTYKRISTERSWAHVPNTETSGSPRALSKVVIYLDTDKVQKRTRHAQFTVKSLLGNIGGAISMYLGFSFLVIFGAIDTAARAILDTAANRRIGVSHRQT